MLTPIYGTMIRNHSDIKSFYNNYLMKHKTEPFVMLDEMNLTFDEFIVKLESCYSFRKMWLHNN